MNTNNASQFFKILEQSILGLDSRTIPPTTKQSFPKYDVIKHDDDRYSLNLALAGYSEADLHISLKENLLRISANPVTDEDAPEIDYIQKGITTRKFDISFKLDNYMEVTDASFEKGLLQLQLTRNIPEAKKTRVIEIS